MKITMLKANEIGMSLHELYRSGYFTSDKIGEAIEQLIADNQLEVPVTPESHYSS
ncbi:hypothetical protein ACOJIU_18835 (plasmid) [Carnobacterium maltaromaticum]|uniref:hypothetical protein n=2 Tax=Carnobacterium maltaromaticum TaxID=2751 RepID=UPI003B980632